MSFFNGVTPQAVADAKIKEFEIGDNDAYIKTVREKLSNKGNPMLEITFANEDGAEIRYYITESEWKLLNLKQLYDAFGIPPNEYTSLGKWLYRKGVVVCKQETYNGETRIKVSYLRSKPLAQAKRTPETGYSPQNGQPVAMEPGYVTPQGQGQSGDHFDDDIPF